MADDLRKHQLMMLEMLKEVDRICRKNGINYMLFAGTMLGAVRHKGFIPWDDDLDIVMMRDEYEQFLRNAEKELDSKEYYLQKEFSPHWPMFFSKLRRNGTACIERYIPKDEETHMGIYIDIFPCDNLYENEFMRRIQFIASKLVIAKALGMRGYRTDSRLKKAAVFLSKILPTRLMADFVQNKKGKTSSMVHTFFGAASKYEKNIYPRQWLSETISARFEDMDFPISSSYEKILSQLYGDYMTPQTKDKRGQKIHAEIIDLEHSYTEYKNIQTKMEFSEYTRSIR